MPRPTEHSASARRPRHAADGTTGTTGPAQPSDGRHRRPETLADSTRLRPAPPRPQPLEKDESGYPSGAWPTVTRHEIRRVEAIWDDAGLDPPVAGTPPAVTVRAAPPVPDAGRSMPAWAGPTGSHRAPGTLPIESWLLFGRRRRRATLTAVAALGVLLVALPLQHRDEPAADRATPARVVATTSTSAVPRQRQSETARPAVSRAAAATRRPAAAATTTPARPSAPAAVPVPPSTAPVSASAVPSPTVAVPAGSGPARSLVSTGSHTVALTFDDGPDPVQTPKILAMLAHYHVKATFCLVGEQVQRHPDIVRQIVAAGHTLCNHTWSHSLTIGTEAPEAIRADLQRTNAAIRRAVPDAAIPFFRAPGGNFSDPLVQVAYGDGMTSLYWRVDPRDWDHPKDEDDLTHVERVVADVRANVRPGAIVLSHDFNQPDTVAAYAELLPWLSENYELGVPSVPAVPADAVPADTPGTSTGSVPPAGPA